MKTSSLFRSFATAAVALLLAFPAAAQTADFTTFVSLGDSLTQGVLDGCVVEYGQRDAWPAVLARQAGVSSFELPLIKSHGLGPCMYLKSLAPTFGYYPNDGVPLNSTLARPYNNLAISGYNTHDVVAKNPTLASDPIGYLTLRGQGTALQQAAALKPSFVMVWIGANDIFGAITSATTIECPNPAVPGCTLTSMASINADLDTIFSTLKAAQGGTAKGVAMTLANGLKIPFVTTVSPVLGTNPANGQPIYALSNVGCPTSVPVCPVPAGSYLTLVAAQYLQAGYGIPCAILPANDPRRANCDKPLPDNYSVNPSTGAVSPGVVLTPPEQAAILQKSLDISAAIRTKAAAYGYKLFDVTSWFDDFIANGRSWGGMTATAAYLAGGLFSYDGAHLSSLGEAVLATDLIDFINANFGNSIPEPDMYRYLFNGDTSSGGYPIPPSSSVALTPDETLSWAAAVFTPDTWLQNLRFFFPDVNQRQSAKVSPEADPAPDGPEVPRNEPDRVN
jgi:lysophospholipase L1-like esterase